ncbi:hypothetical protein SUGI_0457120 [Cryptomeria japonica]|nr:hypothetical protein SUGI_0457120 [Cryptomeria japonica]
MSNKILEGAIEEVWYEKLQTGDVDDRKSTTGGAFFLDSRLISWLSKKQSCTSLSTAESKYVATTTNCTQVSPEQVVLEQSRRNFDGLQQISPFMPSMDIKKFGFYRHFPASSRPLGVSTRYQNDCDYSPFLLSEFSPGCCGSRIGDRLISL